MSYDEIERVTEANDIVKTIGQYVVLYRSGKLFKGSCPWHADKMPSFMVHPDRKTFHCFSCGKGGSVIRFLMTQKNISFREAFHELEATTETTNTSNGPEAVQPVRTPQSLHQRESDRSPVEQQTPAVDMPKMPPWHARDEFAARAMQGMMSFGGPDCKFEAEVSYDVVATMAYDMADAMMEERAKRIQS
jgi:CHC2 zinc finger